MQQAEKGYPMDSNKDPIEKLRNYAENRLMTFTLDRLDEIEAQYMKLPVDADGLPVSIGDKRTRHKTNGKAYEVEELRYDGETWWFESGEGCFSCDSASHVKPDTVESLLAQSIEMINECLADYAERIRKAMDNGD